MEENGAVVQRVIATYTTLPSRYNILIKSIQTLLEQTHKLDAIYVAIPYHSRRLDKPYPTIPRELSNICTIVRTDEDYGPIMKVYAGILSERDPETIILSCDDDVLFDTKHVETLVRHATDNPNACICGTGALISKGLLFISIVSSVKPFKQWSGLTGFNVPKAGRKVDLVFGVGGVAYRRSFFPQNKQLYDDLIKYVALDESLLCNDDVLISGYLSKHGVDRLVFCDIPEVTHADNDEEALSSDLFKMIGRMNRAINKAKELGLFPTMEQLSVDETTAGKVGAALILLFLLIIMAITYYVSTGTDLSGYIYGTDFNSNDPTGGIYNILLM